MLFKLTTAAALLALGGLASALGHKRAVVTDTTLYAYGTNVSGISVFYGDGLAYVGIVPPEWISVASNITFSYDSSDSSVPVTITSNTTTSITGSELYIVPTSGSSQQLGFVASDGTPPTDAVTTGFVWYGTMLGYAASASSDMQMKFWARPTNNSAVWALVWNSDGISQGDCVPVVLKTTHPTVMN